MGTIDGPLRIVTVMLSGCTMTTTRVAYIELFGLFSFAGQTYIVIVLNKNISSQTACGMISAVDDVCDLIFQVT